LTPNYLKSLMYHLNQKFLMNHYYPKNLSFHLSQKTLMFLMNHLSLLNLKYQHYH
jgi:hypothetical protein